jgi:hypothetical protein
MIRPFDEFQVHDIFSKKIALIGENHNIPDLFNSDAKISVQITPNEYSTHQVFNRLAGSDVIPGFVGDRFKAMKLRTPISVISPNSTIQTFPTFRHLNSANLLKGSIYFSKPKIDTQIQVATYEGRIIGAREIIDGKPIHLNTARYPEIPILSQISENLYSKLASEFSRFRIGFTKTGPILLAMENFKLKTPELVDLYFQAYESKLGKIPNWYRHQTSKSLVEKYLSEYINREEISKKCPYLL